MIYKTDVKCFNFFFISSEMPSITDIFYCYLEKKLHIKWVRFATRLEYFKTLYLSQPNPVTFFFVWFLGVIALLPFYTTGCSLYFSTQCSTV